MPRKEEMHDTMVGAATGLVRRPIPDARRLRCLGHDAEDILWAVKDVSFGQPFRAAKA
jgi:hypothetical protein